MTFDKEAFNYELINPAWKEFGYNAFFIYFGKDFILSQGLFNYEQVAIWKILFLMKQERENSAVGNLKYA